MHFYAFNIGDYASHTRHLTHMEDLAYRRLLDIYYLQEKPLCENLKAVARLINMREYSNEVQSVLEEFFVLDQERGWVHLRADEEIEKYHNKQEKAAMAGRTSAMKRSTARATDAQRTLNERSTDVEQTFNTNPTDVQLNKKHEPRNNPNIKNNKKAAASAAVSDLVSDVDPNPQPEPVEKPKRKQADHSDENFNRFWEAYDYNVNRHKALKAWKVIAPDAELTEKIIQAAWMYNKANPGKAYYLHATTWLNGKRWEDDPSTLLPKIAQQTTTMTAAQATKLAASRMIFGDERNYHEQRIIDVTPTETPAGLLGPADL